MPSFLLPNSRGREVRDIQTGLRELGLVIPAHEIEEQVLGVGTIEAVRALQARLGLAPTGKLDNRTLEALANASGSIAGGMARIEGRIVMESGGPAADFPVRVYSRQFGGDVALLGETRTDNRGFYSVSYARNGAAVHVEIRTLDTEDNELPLSATKFDAGPHEVLQLVAPDYISRALPEYERIVADVTRQLGDVDRLADAREDAESADLSILHRTTRWDARLLALLSTATRLAADTLIPEEALYAAFRAGLPTDLDALAGVTPKAFSRALKQCEEGGIVRLGRALAAQSRTAFRNFVVERRNNLTAPGAVSTLGEMLEQSTLTARERELFSDLFVTHADDGAALWKAAQEAGISNQKIETLRLQGKLAYLTVNSARLTASLQDEIGSADDLANLVDLDFYSPMAWKRHLRGLVGGERGGLQKLIPPAYTGETVDDRLEAYAADLARRVRLAFPTRVVSRMLENGDLRLKNDDASAMHRFLTKAEDLGFTLGETPVEKFAREHEREVFAARTSRKSVASTIASLKKLQRMYQITPSDESLRALARLDIGSAYDVTTYSRDGFLALYGEEFPSMAEADLVYRKAHEVHAVTQTVIAGAKQMQTAPDLYAIDGGRTWEQRALASTALTSQYPTLQSLLGSLDYCECEHCRSVLSPAAYLVDLLHLLDPDAGEWAGFLADWAAKHGGDAYAGLRPFDALIARRPDLPHIPLTCENTNTPLPYIDVVNEILEFYVAEGALTELAARDTGSTDSASLLTEPQYLIPEAYDTLRDEVYPLSLPFDLWLETVRRLVEHTDTPLWQLLEAFRTTDLLDPVAGGGSTFGRRAVFTERLGLSPGEWAIFTDEPQDRWYELYGYDSSVGVAAELSSAGALARRLGVSYKELLDIVRTGFVNPALETLVVLREARLEPVHVYSYFGDPRYPALSTTDRAEFEQRLAERAGSSGVDVAGWLEDTWDAGTLDEILVLMAPDAGCDFDETTLCYADASAATPLDFLKINLFVRLWRKLDWSIEETDRAIQALIPFGLLPLNANEDDIGDAMATVLLHLAHVVEIEERLKLPRSARIPLLVLWRDLPTTGRDPLYSQLFLPAGDAARDAAFDHPLGDYLSDPSVLLGDHLATLQGSLRLSVDDMARVLATESLDVATASLSLANVSLLYRHAFLARYLRLTISELIALRELSSIDPFADLSAAPVNLVADDHPLQSTLRFLDFAELVRGSGLRIADFDYLVRHREAPTGPLRDFPEAAVAIVKALAPELRRLREELAVPLDASDLTDDRLRQTLALALEPTVAERLLAMYDGTVQFEALQEGVADPDQLDPDDLADVPEIQVAYDPLRNIQRLSFRGVLLTPRKNAIVAAHPGALLLTLLDSVQVKARAFFDEQCEGILDPTEYNSLFAPVPAGLSDEDAQARVAEKRLTLAAAFFPLVELRLVRRRVVEIVTARLNADSTLIESLLTDNEILEDPWVVGEPLLSAFADCADAGLTAEYFSSPNGAGVPLMRGLATSATTSGRPPTTRSVRFTGYLEALTTGQHKFSVTLGAVGTEVELRFGHLADPVVRGVAGAAGEVLESELVELKAGIPYSVTFIVNELGGSDTMLFVAADALIAGSLERLPLYPADTVDRVRGARVMVSKTLLILSRLALSERELLHVLSHPADFKGFSLNALPSAQADAGSGTVNERFNQLMSLTSYAALKRRLSPDSDDLIAVLERARRTFPVTADAALAAEEVFGELYDRIERLTGHLAEAVGAVAEVLSLIEDPDLTADPIQVSAPGFATPEGLWRLVKALDVLEHVGLPLEAVVRATTIVGSTTTAAEAYGISREIRDAVRARYDRRTWNSVAKPIFDRLRQRRRDALVSYVMNQEDLDQPAKLYERLLIDPGMEPVVETTRIQLAIASVQLFVHRVLLNLEPGVSAATIDSRRWEWMTRYRVWEANRKIFLFPENWLEPEFRDDKTHLFTELEATLFQGELDNDLAEDAFLTYLRDLEQIARLEIVATYRDERPSDPDASVLHVVGRTYKEPHKYFYRRYTHRAWTPWDPIGVDIEGDHIVIVVWRGRPHIFWVSFLEKQQAADPGTDTLETMATSRVSSMQPRILVEAQLHWTELHQGKWVTRAAGGYGEPLRARAGTSFDRREVLVHVSKEYLDDGSEGGVVVHLNGANFKNQTIVPGGKPFGSKGKGKGVKENRTSMRLATKNSRPEVVLTVTSPRNPYSAKELDATRRKGDDSLKVSFDSRIEVTEEGKKTITRAEPAILGRTEPYSLLLCGNRLTIRNVPLAPLEGPFFFQDHSNTFFVEPTLEEDSFVRYDGWGTVPNFGDWDDVLDGLTIVPQWPDLPGFTPVLPVPGPDPMPTPGPGPDPRPPGGYPPYDKFALYDVQPKQDGITTPDFVVPFGESMIGPNGDIDRNGDGDFGGNF